MVRQHGLDFFRIFKNYKTGIDLLLLVRLRDEVRNLPCTSKCRHDAAADLIHIYAFTKCFFRIRVSLVSIPSLEEIMLLRLWLY